MLRGPEALTEKFVNGPGLPVTHIIDREGRLREKIFGPLDRAKGESLIRPLLAESPATAQR